jgi:hypothetical protein
MKIVYGITYKDEGLLVTTTLNMLCGFKTGKYGVSMHDFEIAMLADSSNQADVDKISDMISKDFQQVHLFTRKFDGDFSAHKNYLNECCEKLGADFIFQVDADETLTWHLIKGMDAILESNPNVDLFYFPRMNLVNGITDEDIKKWKWQVTYSPAYGKIINWPDPQGRLYKAGSRWEGKVHERIKARTFALVPMDISWQLLHSKTIEKQRQQNAYYDSLATDVWHGH